MCKLIFRVRPKALPMGITRSANPVTNFERYQEWAAKWFAVHHELPSMTDLQDELAQLMARETQKNRAGVRVL
jgi:hypothetical protein